MSALGAEPDRAGDPHDVRPVVARRSTGDMGLWIFLAILLVGGAGLFAMLSTGREAVTAPRTTAIAPQPGERISSPPPLALRGDGMDDYPERYRLVPRSEVRPVVAAPAPIVQPSAPSPRAAPAPLPPSWTDPAAQPPAPRPSLVYSAARDSLPPPTPSSLSDRSGNERVRAGRLASPSLTVPRGTVIPAVLETALDSTRPGAARALVQRDITGFDGSRVLIPRGSRLYGEYGADLGQGQNRALIRWTRLIRPDGVTIALDSPASDPLGRAGVKGKVDSKFFQRFGGAILQSVLDIGVGVATREATDGVVVALPGSTQNIQGIQPQQIMPTLKVRHGTSVSVFVARDLDFSSVEY